jgi:hypothetical protein
MAQAGRKPSAPERPRSPEALEVPGAGGERPRKKANPMRLQALEGKIGEIESTIQVHETRIAVLSERLASEELYRDYPLFRVTMEEHDLLKDELEAMMATWERLQAELAALRAG